jgi:transposase, IS6 family
MSTCHPRPAAIARSAFAGFCFPPDVIVLAVRWYLRFALSYRDIEELFAEPGIDVDVFVSPRRDLRAARRFFERAIGTTRTCPAGS